MSLLRLRVIPEPEPNTRSVLRAKMDGPYFRGQDSALPDLVCGLCSHVLATGIDRLQIIDLVLHCKNCGAFNETALFE